jgi:hypothetical protein
MLMTEIFRVAADFMASSSASSDAMIAEQVPRKYGDPLLPT